MLYNSNSSEIQKQALLNGIEFVCTNVSSVSGVRNVFYEQPSDGYSIVNLGTFPRMYEIDGYCDVKTWRDLNNVLEKEKTFKISLPLNDFKDGNYVLLAKQEGIKEASIYDMTEIGKVNFSIKILREELQEENFNVNGDTKTKSTLAQNRFKNYFDKVERKTNLALGYITKPTSLVLKTIARVQQSNDYIIKKINGVAGFCNSVVAAAQMPAIALSNLTSAVNTLKNAADLKNFEDLPTIYTTFFDTFLDTFKMSDISNKDVVFDTMIDNMQSLSPFANGNNKLSYLNPLEKDIISLQSAYSIPIFVVFFYEMCEYIKTLTVLEDVEKQVEKLLSLLYQYQSFIDISDLLSVLSASYYSTFSIARNKISIIEEDRVSVYYIASKYYQDISQNVIDKIIERNKVSLIDFQILSGAINV